ncbi:MAG: hypothetical protein AVDCRST_MAG16-626, partial [uncultured Frankineae bacterium]
APRARVAGRRDGPLLRQGLPGLGRARAGVEQPEGPRAGPGEDLGGLRRPPGLPGRAPGRPGLPDPRRPAGVV